MPNLHIRFWLNYVKLEETYEFYYKDLVAILAKTIKLQFAKKIRYKTGTLSDSDMSQKLCNMSHTEDNVLRKLLREHPE